MNETKKQREIGQLIAEHRPKLKTFIRNRVSNVEDAEDILQDVFYRLLTTIDNSMNPIEHVSAWLYKVARNLIINRSVKKREERLPSRKNEENNNVLDDFSEILFGDEMSASPETEYLRSLVWSELENAMNELPPEQREIFELTELNGVPVKEISEISEIPVNTLLSRKHYAVKHLRKRLAELYEEITEIND